MTTAMKTLKNIWNKAVYGAVKTGLFETKDVRAEMEKQGWNFQEKPGEIAWGTYAAIRGPISETEIFNPDGEKVSRCDKEFRKARNAAADKICKAKPRNNMKGPTQ